MLIVLAKKIKVSYHGALSPSLAMLVVERQPLFLFVCLACFVRMSFHPVIFYPLCRICIFSVNSPPPSQTSKERPFHCAALDLGWSGCVLPNSKKMASSKRRFCTR